ncbi:MAG: hypothetical protein JW708_11130, partial [Vallitaleaceae bacterium]|nr:hypothetical protein [Vallitaleaceae bacterium]
MEPGMEAIKREFGSQSIDCSTKRVRVNRRKQNVFYLVVILIIGILAFGIYFNSLNNNFVNWDDPGLILKNQKIRSLEWQNIKEIFTPKKASTYQPIRVLSYAIDYHFWKLNPAGFRLTNILFYILTCIMVFFTLRRLSMSIREKASPDSHDRVALFGSLLFVAHPVHVEAITWLAARKEVLQGFFFFLAFYLYLRGREEKDRKRMIYLVLVLFSILLATLSKPSAVVFPGVILIYEISKSGKKWISFFKTHWVFLSLTIVISMIFTFILLKVMFEAGGIKPYRGSGIGSNILICMYVFLESIKLLVFTINYSAAYSFSVSMPVFALKNIVLIFITVALFAISVLSLRRTKIIFFSLFFFLITLLPYLNIFPISTLKADRYVFIASFSFIFLLGIGFDRLYGYQHKKLSEGFFKLISVVLFLFLLAGYSFMTIRQNTI